MINQQSLKIDNLWDKVEGLKRDRRDLTLIIEVDAQGVKLAMQLEEVERCFIDQVE